jgi:hypothetical protein
MQSLASKISVTLLMFEGAIVADPAISFGSIALKRLPDHSRQRLGPRIRCGSDWPAAKGTEPDLSRLRRA